MGNVICAILTDMCKTCDTSILIIVCATFVLILRRLLVLKCYITESLLRHGYPRIGGSIALPERSGIIQHESDLDFLFLADYSNGHASPENRGK